jgi:hypothetical protein
VYQGLNTTPAQVLKVIFPVYYGAQYQCVKMPRHAVIKALKAQQNEKLKIPQVPKGSSDKPGSASEGAGLRRSELADS